MNEINESIQCRVDSCRYHDGAQQYCTLSHITVGKECNCSKSCSETECASFEYGE